MCSGWWALPGRWGWGWGLQAGIEAALQFAGGPAHRLGPEGFKTGEMAEQGPMALPFRSGSRQALLLPLQRNTSSWGYPTRLGSRRP